MRKLLAITVLAVLGSTGAQATKEPEIVFTETPEDVFEAAFRVARSKYILDFVDEKRLTVRFHEDDWQGITISCNAFAEKKSDGTTDLGTHCSRPGAQLIGQSSPSGTRDEFRRAVYEVFHPKPPKQPKEKEKK